MDALSTLFDSTTFKWIILPLLIFSARIIDVTLGTIRIIYISRGLKYLAPIFGFFEVLIWLLAIGQIMQNLTNVVYYIAYATGFATGNFVGIYIEERMAVGTVIIRIITQKDASELIQYLRSEGYGVTSIDATGMTGPVKVIFTTIRRQNLEEIIKHIRRFNPKAFFSVEDVRFAKEGVFPPPKKLGSDTLKGLLKWQRKGK
ncbi:MAG: DUF2179 domain-containing protein [Deltaproteobacteria bacterium]|nr:DUF2179 domain-containing protein [Deltaproteobacteria bacterium]